MISVKPGSFGHRVLALVVQTPGISGREIAAELLPPPRPAAFASPAEYFAWRADEAARAAAETARELHVDAAATRVARVLGRLQEMKLLETRGPPRLPGPVNIAIRYERERLLREWPALLESLAGPAVLTPEEAWVRAIEHVIERRLGLAASGRQVAMVEALLAGGVASTRELLGEDAGGATKRAYGELVRACLIDPPARRWPTERGIAVLAAGGGRLREVAGVA